MRPSRRQTEDGASSRALGATYAGSLGALVVVLAAAAWLAVQVMPEVVPPGAAATRMVRVPGGPVVVESIDGPVTVRVRALEVDRAEVTVASYRACVAAGKCAPPSAPRDAGGQCHHEDPERLGSPMSCVSVKEAIDYCQWQDARLPTASEWRYLAFGAAGAEAGLRDVADGLEEWACDVAPEAEEVDDVVCWTFAKMGEVAAGAARRRARATRGRGGGRRRGGSRKTGHPWRDGHRSVSTGFRCVR